MKFKELNLNEDLLKGIRDAKFEACMPVQVECFEHTLKNRDVYVQSQTGSGKTAAFLITIFEMFSRDVFEKKRAVIIVPTRELAIQIEREAKLLGGHLPYRIGSFYGGVGYGDQLRMLKENYEVIIGTPGRLIDLNERKNLDFRATSVLVIDEADRLFDMGFLPDLRKMVRRMPPADKRLTMLYSATLNSRVWHLAWEHMNDPVEIVINPENLTVDEVKQELYHVAREEKLQLLLGILRHEKPENALVFTNTKQGAEILSKRLSHNGYESRYIIGDLPQKKRIQLIDRLKKGELKILVATDVAARGLHVDDLPLVVNYDLPEDPEGYVHRIGRTARAGNTGKAVSLACERYVYGLESIEELIERKIPVVSFDSQMLEKDESKGIFIETDDHDDRRRSGGSGRSGSGRSRSNRSRSRPSASSGSGRSDSGHSASRKPETVGSGPGRAGSAENGPGRSKSESSGAGSDSAKPVPSTQRTGSGGSGAKKRKRPERGRSNEGKQRPGKAAEVKRSDSLEDRIAYYRKKYGEDFRYIPESGQNTEDRENEKKEKKGLGGAFRRLFGKSSDR